MSNDCVPSQDKLVLRVQTAKEEVAHLKDFDYGEWLHCSCFSCV